MFVISKHVLISVGFSCGNDYYKDYFGTDSLKNFIKNFLCIECKFNIKPNKPMIFFPEDELYHNDYILCHICDKQSRMKVRDHCHKTG